MSEHDDRTVLTLLDRAATDAPPMHLDTASVLEGGRRRVRRRRATYAGMTLAAAASVAAVSFGALGDGFLTTQEAPPARQDAGPTRDRVVSGEWDAELTFEDGTTVTLRPDGDGVVAESPSGDFQLAESELVAGPVLSTVQEGRPVMLVPDWEPSSPDAIRLRSVDVAGTQWMRPTDTARVELADGRSLVVLTMAFPNHESGSFVPGELLRDGSVELAVEGPAGTTLTMSGDTVVPALDGQPLPEAEGPPVFGAEAYDAGELGVVFVLDAPADARLAAIVLEEDGPRVREDHVADITPVTTSTLVGVAPPATELLGFAVQSPQAVEAEAVNQWSLAGSADNGHVAVDGGVLAVSADTDLWLLTPEGAEVPTAGRVDEDVIAVRRNDTSALLVTVTDQETNGVVILRDGATAPEGGTVLGDHLAGRLVVFDTISLPDGARVTDYVEGVDADVDGVADLSVTQVVDLTGAPTE